LYENGFPGRNQDLLQKTQYDPAMPAINGATPSSAREIRSEARGPHWVAWIADANGKPEGSIVLVGGTRKEAEERARQWRDEITRPSV
jgi:hypothetical protein